MLQVVWVRTLWSLSEMSEYLPAWSRAQLAEHKLYRPMSSIPTNIMISSKLSSLHKNACHCLDLTSVYLRANRGVMRRQSLDPGLLTAHYLPT